MCLNRSSPNTCNVHRRLTGHVTAKTIKPVSTAEKINKASTGKQGRGADGVIEEEKTAGQETQHDETEGKKTQQRKTEDKRVDENKSTKDHETEDKEMEEVEIEKRKTTEKSNVKRMKKKEKQKKGSQGSELEEKEEDMEKGKKKDMYEEEKNEKEDEEDNQKELKAGHDPEKNIQKSVAQEGDNSDITEEQTKKDQSVSTTKHSGSKPSTNAAYQLAQPFFHLIELEDWESEQVSDVYQAWRGCHKNRKIYLQAIECSQWRSG